MEKISIDTLIGKDRWTPIRNWNEREGEHYICSKMKRMYEKLNEIISYSNPLPYIVMPKACYGNL